MLIKRFKAEVLFRVHLHIWWCYNQESKITLHYTPYYAKWLIKFLKHLRIWSFLLFQVLRGTLYCGIPLDVPLGRPTWGNCTHSIIQTHAQSIVGKLQLSKTAVACHVSFRGKFHGGHLAQSGMVLAAPILHRAPWWVHGSLCLTLSQVSALF